MSADENPPAGPEPTGVLGGTFDPVHLGHIHAAESVREAFSLRRVFLVPCAIPPHKDRPGLSSADHRLAMLRLATADLDWIEVLTLEIDRGGVSYTLDTLHALASGSPPVRPLFILGMDALMEIHTWKNYLALVREFDLVAVDRPGGDLGRIRERLEAEVASRVVPVAPGPPLPPPGDGGRIYHLPITPLPVSSSVVRSRAAMGAPLDGLVPASVARYIRDWELYQEEEPR